MSQKGGRLRAWRERLTRGEARTIAKFVVVGVGSNVLNFISFLLLVGAGVNYFAAGVAGYLVGLLNSFILGYTFVFKQEGDGPRRSPLRVAPAFLLVYGVGALLMGAGVDAAVSVLKLPPILAWLLVAAFVVVWNYVLSKRFVFRS